MILPVVLLVFAGLTLLGTLFVVASRLSGGTRVWITCYNTGLIATLIAAAIQLMH